jgi:O-antigen ligase
VTVPALGVEAGVCAGVGLVVAGVAFGASGGTALTRTTVVEVLLMLGGAGLVATAILVPRADGSRRLYGAWTLAGLGALTVLTAISITWSLAPGDSWVETNRMLAYLATFAGALALVRLAPKRWPSVLGGVALGCVLVVIGGLTSKVLPGTFAADETFARLRAPFGYWNATGLACALAVPPLLWLAAKRSGNLALNALAYPALGLSFVCLLLSYSRGALLALAVGLVFWFAVVPLRLRAAVALAAAGLATVPVITWAFAREALTDENAILVARSQAGRELGALLLLMVVLLGVVGLAVGFAAANRAPALRTRRLVGLVIGGLLAAVAIGALVAVATKPGGLDGQVSKAYTQLTDPDAGTPDNSPERLTATASVRSRYWREAYEIFAAEPVLGAGAGSFAVARTRYRTGLLIVRQAHGYVAETMASLGVLGLAVSLALLVAWLGGAARTTGLGRRTNGVPP